MPRSIAVILIILLLNGCKKSHTGPSTGAPPNQPPAEPSGNRKSFNRKRWYRPGHVAKRRFSGTGAVFETWSVTPVH